MLINAYRLNHDKKVWGDPEAFRPERFLDENMTLIKDSCNKILSFGAGM
jgi:cytochrome P450